MYVEERNTQKLCKAIEAQTGTTTAIHSITKSSGRKLYEIVIGEGNPFTSPVIYMDESLVAPQEHWNILQGTLAMYHKCKSLENAGCDFNTVKRHIHSRLVNYEKNIRFLKNIPHHRIFDLALIPVLLLREVISENTFYAMLNIQSGMWQSTADELLQAAYDNEKNDCMIEALESSAEELGFEAFLMSNSFHFATIEMLTLRRLAEETYSKHLYLVLASTHEILVIPEDNVFDVEELKALAERLNTSLEREETFLSESIYRFSNERNIIEII